MRIRNFLHKGLRALYEDDSIKGVPSASAAKLRNMLAVLDDLQSVEELRSLHFWKPHPLAGSRKGNWSLSVTRNWRFTFWIDEEEPAACDVNLENYH